MHIAGSSFVWMSRYTSTRSFAFPEGLPSITPTFTLLGNILLARMCLLVRILLYKNCQWILEQPSTSFVPRMPRFQDLIRDSTASAPFVSLICRYCRTLLDGCSHFLMLFKCVTSDAASRFRSALGLSNSDGTRPDPL
jgi:hypothetical protein